MARYAIILSGTVHNVIESDAAFAASYASSLGGQAVLSATAGPGDSYNAGVFTPATPAVALPDAATKYFFVEGLEDSMGLTENDVDAAIAAMANGRPKRKLKNWWGNAPLLRRKGQRMNDLQALMGWNNAQVNSIFAAAVLADD
jgi:hypothetical protein